MSEPKPDAAPDRSEAESAVEAARVREVIGAGLRTFYEAVLDEPIPADWLKLVADDPPKESG
ncbi:MAG: NepR family anti-sigma factor [Hyphomonadaceae bacterium]